MGSLTKDDIQINLSITIPNNVLSEQGRLFACNNIDKIVKTFGEEMKEKILNLLREVQ
jgi:hypothetical protein